MTQHLSMQSDGSFADLDYQLNYVEFHLKEAAGRNLHSSVGFPSEYVSALAAATYMHDIKGGNRPAVVNAVVDALSAFQVLSKTWASLCLHYLVRHLSVVSPARYTSVNGVYVGAWFGQQAVCDLSVLDRFTLIDKDPVACAVANQAMQIVMFDSPDFIWHVVNKDIFDIHPRHCYNFENPYVLNYVAITGLEHYDPENISDWVDTLTKGTYVLVQATDMPAPDHVKLYENCEQVMALFPHTNPVIAGTMATNIGKRHTYLFQI